MSQSNESENGPQAKTELFTIDTEGFSKIKAAKRERQQKARAERTAARKQKRAEKAEAKKARKLNVKRAAKWTPERREADRLKKEAKRPITIDQRLLKAENALDRLLIANHQHQMNIKKAQAKVNSIKLEKMKQLEANGGGQSNEDSVEKVQNDGDEPMKSEDAAPAKEAQTELQNNVSALGEDDFMKLEDYEEEDKPKIKKEKKDKKEKKKKIKVEEVEVTEEVTAAAAEEPVKEPAEEAHPSQSDKQAKKDRKAEKKRKREEREEEEAVVEAEPAAPADEEPEEKKHKKHKKSKKDADASQSSNAQQEEAAAEDANGEHWNVGDLAGGSARQDKFMRLLGGKKAGAASSSDPASSTKKESKKKSKGSDSAKVAEEIQQQYDYGMKLKTESHGQKRGLGA